MLGVGHIAIDHHFSVAQPPAAGLKNPASAYRQLVGGMTANALVAAARLGAQTALLSPVGDDAAADVFAAHLQREGVDAAGLHRVAGAQSSISAVIVDAQGERLIVNHRGNALTRAPALDAATLAAALRGTQALLTDPRCVFWAEAALRAARAQGVLSVLDADSSPREDLTRLVGLAHWVVFSTPGLAAFSDDDPASALAAALAAGAQVAVVTRGAQGLQWQRRDQPLCHLAAEVVSPVLDTTAAGDVFHGALAVALAEGQPDESALHFAAAAAALKCQHADAVLGAPRRAELNRYLELQGHCSP